MAFDPDRPHTTLPAANFGRSELGLRSRSSPMQWRFGLLNTPAGSEDGHLSLVENALTVTLGDKNGLSGSAFTTEGMEGRTPTSGASVSWQPMDALVGFDAGWTGERETLLGSSAKGAFGTLAANTAFVGIRTDRQLGGWQDSANAEMGTVYTAIKSGLIDKIAPLTASSFALGASRSIGDGG